MTATIDMSLAERFACFHELEDAEARAAALNLEPITLSAGQVLFRQGDPCESVFLLVSGKIAIQIRFRGQEDHTLATLEPCAILGEIGLLLNQTRTATAVAVTDVELWRITRTHFHAALERKETWATKFVLSIVQVLARRLSAVDEQLITLIEEGRRNGTKPQGARLAELEELRNRLFDQWSF